MLVLVATNQGQNPAERDFCFTVEGELVTPVVFSCSNPECGCDRSFSGLSSSRATTTARVADIDGLDYATFRAAVADALDRQGWAPVLEPWAPDVVDEHVGEILEIAEHFGEGVVLRCNNGTVYRATRDAA